MRNKLFALILLMFAVPVLSDEIPTGVIKRDGYFLVRSPVYLEDEPFVYVFRREGYSLSWKWECSLSPNLEAQNYSHASTMFGCLKKARLIKQFFEAGGGDYRTLYRREKRK